MLGWHLKKFQSKFISKEIGIQDSNNLLYTNVLGSFICNAQPMKTVHILTDGWVNIIHMNMYVYTHSYII